MAGQLLTLEIPNLNLVYEDDTALVIDHFYEDKHIIHSEIKVEADLKFLKHASKVFDIISETYKEHGIDEIYTWGEDETHDRYNLFLKFKPTGKVFTVPNYDKELSEYVRKL